ncbi:hypothetical protein JCM8547_006920 [Rhodosporidiobolus lusitaniae]
MTTSTSYTLSARLGEPLGSTSQLLDLLLPPLHALSLLPDRPDLVSLAPPAPGAVDPSRFVKRQLGLVQKVLVERVWPDWETAVEAELGKDGLVVFERWYIPPRTTSKAGGDSPIVSEVALSAYAVLSSLFSAKTAVILRPRSLEIISTILVRLSNEFNVEQLYLTLFTSTSIKPSIVRDDPDDEEDGPDPARLVRWEQTSKDMMNVPTRVANAWGALQAKKAVPAGRAGLQVPRELDVEPYFATFTISFLSLLWHLAGDSSSPAYSSALSSALTPLLSSPSFLPTAIPIVVSRLLPPVTFPTPPAELLQRQRHLDLWRRLTSNLSERDFSRFLRSVLLALEKDLSTFASSSSPAQRARSAAFLLNALFGPLTFKEKTSWKLITAVLFERNASWNAQLVPLVAVLWVGEDEEALVELMKVALGTWGAKEELKSSSDSRRLYLTSLFLLSVVSLPPLHPAAVELSRSPAFLSAVSTHLSLVAPLQRLLGMLVAEVVSSRTVSPGAELKPLSFGEEIWGGEEPEKRVARRLREVVEEVAQGKMKKVEGWQEVLRQAYERDEASSRPAQPLPAKVNSQPLQPSSVEEPLPPPPAAAKRPLISIIGDSDSDDDLTPYPLPLPPSSSTLEILNSSDPALYHSAFPSPQSSTSGPGGGASQTRKRGKLRPPVYVPELVAYLKGSDPEGGKSEEADGQAERVEMGLKEGEGLVRRKAGWGGELSENAVDLAFALMGLQDQFELENFDMLKQNIFVALLVACPNETVPVVIEQYFLPSYSLAQRHTLLASLALSARELAGLPIPAPPPSSSSPLPPPSAPSPPISLFPSKQLPPAMHRRLVGPPTSPLDSLSADLTRLALSDAREDAEQTVPGAAREKLLNVRRAHPSSPRSSLSFRSALSSLTTTTTTPSYTALSAPLYILPLINRFYLYLRDVSTSPSSSLSHLSTSSAPLLEPYLLSKFLATLSVLVHAARHSLAFLAVVAPEVLGLVLTLRPPSHSSPTPRQENDDAEDLSSTALNRSTVLSSLLELALVTLSTSVELDGGRTLMSNSSVSGGAGMVLEVQKWAEVVFELEEARGAGEEGGIGRAGRAAAGVVLRVEEVLERWRGSVGW